MIGKTISHYKILEKIGAGGMGVVYKALDMKLDRHVALKFLPHHVGADEDERKRFIHEAKAASALDHPNICTLHEIDETTDGQLFISMACYEGKTLKSILQKGKLPIEKAIDIAIQVAQGLAKAHQYGIIHRDIKPANIIITEDGIVKILDFGLAKLSGQSQITSETSTVGTASYMSPEQAGGHEVDVRTDIWSLGVVLYEMISGERPFSGDYEQAVIYSILNEDPLPFRDIPGELEAIIFTALEKNKEQRYQQIDDMLVDLNRYQQSLKHEAGEHSINRIIKPSAGKKNILYIGIFFIFLISVFLLRDVIFPPQVTERKSIAVLPFENLNKDPDSEYFSDGITEDILTQLSKIGELKVVSRTSSIRFKDSNKSLIKIGNELNVTNILEGTIRRENNNIRITAQLVDVKSDEQLWAETYDRKINSIFEIQSEVAKRIAEALKVELSPQVKKRIDKKPTENLTAYDFYLKGREYYYRYTETENENAITLFKTTIKHDPSFALAYAGLADAFGQKVLRFNNEDRWLDSALVQCDKALAIDAELAEAYKARALVYFTKSWFQKALDQNFKALEYNPNYYPATGNIGWIYYHLGQFDKALHWINKALEINATNSNLTSALGFIYIALHDYQNANYWFKMTMNLNPKHKPNPLSASVLVDLMNKKYEKALEKSKFAMATAPNDVSTLLAAADAYLQYANPKKAITYYEKAITLEPHGWNFFTGVNTSTSLAYIFWKTGFEQKAAELIRLSQEIDQKNIAAGSEWWGVAYDLACIYSIQNNKDEAMVWLNKAFEKGWRFYFWAEIDPLLENLRDEEKFKDLMIMTRNVVNQLKKNI